MPGFWVHRDSQPTPYHPACASSIALRVYRWPTKRMGDIELDMVPYMEVDKVADMVADKKNLH